MFLGTLIRIQPDLSLEETARIVSETLDVPLEFDKKGVFGECPAYHSVARNLSFALLGPPDPKNVIGTFNPNYDLNIRPLAARSIPDPEVGKDAQRRLVAQGLRCELIN